MAEIFFSSKKNIKKGYYSNIAFKEIVNNFSKEKNLAIYDITVNDQILICDLISRNWQSKKSKIYKILLENNLGFLISWLKAQNIKRSLITNFKDLSLLNFKDIRSNNNVIIYPKGTIVHWIAGNVPVLGLISLFQGLITKNKNILKVPSNYKNILPILLEDIRKMKFKINNKTLCGKDFIGSTLIVYADRDDFEAHKIMSMASDIRVAWGGKSAIETISKLPKKITCEDIFFGPKISIGVISKEYLRKESDIKDISRKISRDVFSFDQLGCNAPHNIYIEYTTDKNLNLLVEHLKQSFNSVSIGKNLNNPSELEVLNILTNRIVYSSNTNKKAVFGNNFNWSILIDKKDHSHSDPVYFRTLFIKVVKNITDVPEYFPSNIQTIGCALSKRKFSEFCKKALIYGGLRFSNLGEMSLYENPWDGIMPISRMVNYIRLPK